MSALLCMLREQHCGGPVDGSSEELLRAPEGARSTFKDEVAAECQRACVFGAVRGVNVAPCNEDAPAYYGSLMGRSWTVAIHLTRAEVHEAGA